MGSIKDRDYSQIGREISAAEFKGKVITHLQYIRDDITEIKEAVGENDKRITRLEKVEAKIIAVASFIAGAISVGFHIFQLWIKGNK